MANYQQFEQNYPTLNKFIGAAREAASVIPGAGYLTPQGQQYDDARTRFQQQSPNAAMAGKLAGYGVDAGLATGIGGLGLGALGRAATRAAMPEALESAAASGSNFAPQLVQSMAANAPRFISPSPGNIAAGAQQARSLFAAAPTVPAAVAGLGIGAGGAMLANRGPNMAAQQEAAAKPVNEMNSQVWAARPNDTPDEHTQRLRLINFMNNGRGPSVAPQNIAAAPAQPGTAAQQMQDQNLASLVQRRRQQAELQRQRNIPLFPGHRPDLDLGTNLEIAKLSPKPHYQSASDEAARAAMAFDKANLAKLQASGASEQVLGDYIQQMQKRLMALGTRNSNPYATADAYGITPPDTDYGHP
jgi:hypothetical protein